MVDAGIDPGPAVDEVVALGAGHPQRTMLLAHHLFDLPHADQRGTTRPGRHWSAR